MINSKFKIVAIFMLTLTLVACSNSQSEDVNGDGQDIVAPDSPVASIEPGNYFYEQQIELNSNTPDVNIYYTLDGSEPTNESKLYSKPIKIEHARTINAVAILQANDKDQIEKEAYSDMASFNYTFETRQSIAEKFIKSTYESMPYRLYVPEDYDSNESYPLVMFLHGGGERGDDNERHLMASDGAIIWATPENQAKNPAFVLAPQASTGVNGGFGLTRDKENEDVVELSRALEVGDDVHMAYEVLQKVREEYNIDSNRLYVTGLSQGGFGSYHLNTLYPDLFAAMVPIAGGGDPEKAELLVNKPIWNFHAEDDGIVPVSFSRDIIESIKEAGGDPIYTEYPAEEGYNHGSWVPAYQDQEMIDWLFKQVKTDN